MKIKKTILTAAILMAAVFLGTEQECRDQYIHLERYMHATA